MSILTSFLAFNSSALTEVEFMGVFPSEVVTEEFVSNPAKVFFDSESFAAVSVTNFGYENYRTNLRASTQAYNPNSTTSSEIQTTLFIYAELEVEFSDGTTDQINHEEIIENGAWGRAVAVGNSIMPGNAYITGFDSFHFARVYEVSIDESNPDGYVENIYCLGDIMYHITYSE